MRKTAGLILFVSLIMASCLEELEDIDKAEVGTLNPDVAMPLVSSSFTMEEFLTEGSSEANISEENGVILLSYSDTVISQGADSIFQVEDQNSPDLVVSGTAMSAIPANSSQTFSFSETFTINITGGDQLDSITLSAGELLTIAEINAPVSGSVNLVFNSIQSNGQPIQQSLSWSFDGTNSSQTVSESEDLANSSIILTVGGNTNEISFDATITITNEGTAVSNTDEVRVGFTMTNMIFSGVFGDIATRNIATPEKSELIDIFNNINEGTFELDNPRLALTFINSFGLPVALGINRIRAEAQNGDFIQLSGDVVTNQSPFLLDAPTLAEVGQSKNSILEINAQNSNLNDLLSSFPSRLIYRFPGQIDPSDQVNNFILAESEVSILVDTELPLSGTISSLVMNKLFEFDGKGISELNEATLVINTINTFPLDARLQVYFLDDASNRIDSLYDDNFGMLMSAAQIDGQGFSTTPGEVNDRVRVDAGEIDRIDMATQLQMRVILQTANGGTTPIKVSPNNNLQINMGLESELEINL